MTIKRLDAMRDQITIAALLLIVVLLRGPRLLGAWYNNLASLALRLEWQGVHQSVGIASCPQPSAELAVAQQCSRALRLDPSSVGARMNAARLAWLRGDCEAALDEWAILSSGDEIACLERANALYALGRQGEAVQQYRQIGRAASYLRIRGDLSESAQDEETAITWYKLSMEVRPTNDTAATLATLYVERGQHGAALEVLDGLSEGTQGSEPWLWWRLGQSAQEAGAWDIAQRAFERGAQVSDRPCLFWEMQASMLDRLEEWASVETVSLQAQAECPDQRWPYLRLGGLRYREGDLDAALHWYRQTDGAEEHLRTRGELAEEAGNTEAAISWYELSMAVLPTAETAASLAALYVEKGQHDAALAVLDSLSEGTQSTEPWLWWRLGESAQEAGAWDIALQAFQRGAQQSDEPCAFWEAQAGVLDRLEEWGTVETVSLQALAVCPDQLWPYLRLGGLRRRADELDAALQWYRQAEQLWPQHVAPKYYVGVILFDQQEYEQARVYLEQVLELEPDHLWATYRLAWILHEAGDVSTAVETLSRAIQLHGQEPWEMAVELGHWYVELARPDEALAAYQQALAWNPGDERIQARIDRLTRPSP